MMPDVRPAGRQLRYKERKGEGKGEGETDGEAQGCECESADE